MKLTSSFSSPRRVSALSSIIGGRSGRTRTARMFPAEAERLITPAELKRLHA